MSGLNGNGAKAPEHTFEGLDAGKATEYLEFTIQPCSLCGEPYAIFIGLDEHNQQVAYMHITVGQMLELIGVMTKKLAEGLRLVEAD